jgi:hypothetical protein
MSGDLPGERTPTRSAHWEAKSPIWPALVGAHPPGPAFPHTALYRVIRFYAPMASVRRTLTVMANFTPLDAAALEEGYQAGRRGLTIADNPYPPVMCEAIAWAIGFADGRKKRLQVVGGSPSAKS